jgi:hypothetical protein
LKNKTLATRPKNQDLTCKNNQLDSQNPLLVKKYPHELGLVSGRLSTPCGASFSEFAV